MANATSAVKIFTTPWGDDKIKRDLYGSGSEVIYYPNSMICLRADGYATKGADTAGLVFDGLLENSIRVVVGASDSSGDVVATVRRPYRFSMTIAATIAIAQIGAPVFILYDNEVTLASTNRVLVGYIEAIISTTEVLIRPWWASETRKTPVAAKTADYTITAADSGKVLTTRGASGAVIFTLPTVAAAFNGVDVTIFNCVDQDMTVAAQTAGQLMFKHDVAANSLTYSTANEKIGGAFRCVCDGTSWLVMPLAEEAQTITVVT